MSGQSKMVPGYIHWCFLIHREFTGSIKDTTTGSRCTIHLKKSDSDLNRLPALAAYLLLVTTENFVIEIIEVHLNDFLFLCEVELVQIGSLLYNFQWLPRRAFRCSDFNCCNFSRCRRCCLRSGLTISSSTMVRAWASKAMQEWWISGWLFCIYANNVFFAVLFRLMCALTAPHIKLKFIYLVLNTFFIFYLN